MFRTYATGKSVCLVFSVFTFLNLTPATCSWATNPGIILVDDSKATPPIPLPPDAENMNYDAESGSLQFDSATGPKELAQFFRDAMKKLGWTAEPSVIDQENMVDVMFSKGEDQLNFTMMKMGDHTQFSAEGEALASKAAADSSAASDSSAQVENGNTLLTFTDKDGLPVPNEGVSSGSESTIFRHSISATVAAKVAVVVDMYRKELSAKGWKEVEDKTKISDDAATVIFDTPNGPATLTVKRDGSDTSLQLGISDKLAASKSPLFPKPGQVKVALGNITEKTVTVKIGGKAIKVKALAGSKAPDGPMIDIAPGTFKAEMQGVQTETIEAGPDQIWMIMVGPGGLLPIQAY